MCVSVRASHAIQLRDRAEHARRSYVPRLYRDYKLLSIKE